MRLALVLTLCAGAAIAQDGTADAARAAADRLDMAAALLLAAEGSDDQIAALTETVRAYEDGLAAMREGLRRAAIRTRTLETEMEAREEDIARLLAVLMAMDPDAAPLLLLHPSGGLGTARAGIILSDVTPALQAEADALRARLAELAEVRAIQDSAARTLTEGLAGAQEARARLAEAVSNRTDLPIRFAEDPAAMTALIAGAETLDAFASGLADTVDGEMATLITDAPSRAGTLSLPVTGTILRRAGEADAAGVVRPGLVIATGQGALVTAPVASTVRFVGPLLDYGQVVILEPAPDVLFVIAGMAQTFGATGQVIPEGAPVGLMGGNLPGADAILNDSAAGVGADRPETLYLEVRDGQGPVDPATWFALE